MKRILLAATAAISFAVPAAATTVVTADRMLDVITGRYVDHPAIFIDDSGHITSVADARTVRFTDQVKRIDLPGETLLPGLIDMHVHLSSLAEIGGYQGLKFTDNFWVAAGGANAVKTLKAGFTTVRNVGSSGFRHVALVGEDDGGAIPGPPPRAPAP